MDGKSTLNVGSRRGRPLQPIQTDIGSSRPQLGPVAEDGDAERRRTDQVHARTIPTPKSSKTSLKSLFKKATYSRRSTINNDPRSPSTGGPPKPQSNAPPGRYTLSPAPGTSTVSSPVKSRNDDSTVTSPTSPRLVKAPRDKGPRAISSWDPPPLFKAYPQAIKHATLQCPSVSAETLLRLNASEAKRKTTERENVVDSGRQVPSRETARKRREERRGQMHARRSSDMLKKTGWTRKIFILVTSGYLLQYNGDGNFDRLPEKMMALGKNSVAFASDAIPGKHWVIQISHITDVKGNGETVDTKKSLLARLRFPESRRMTKSLLLVLNSAEELSTWLMLVRREIEALGGKEYVPETPIDEVRETPLHRYQSQKLKNQESHTNGSDLAERTMSPTPSIKIPQMPINKSGARSVRQSIETLSFSTTTTSTDADKYLDDRRSSFVSAGTRTMPSSRGSSPTPSIATIRSPSLRPGVESPKSLKHTTTRVIAIEPPDRRSSIAKPRSHRPSGLGTERMRARPLVSQQSTPNFSLPILNKRHSTSLSSRTPPPQQQGAKKSQLPTLRSPSSLKFHRTDQPVTNPAPHTSRSIPALRSNGAVNETGRLQQTAKNMNTSNSTMAQSRENSTSTPKSSSIPKAAQLPRRFSSCENGLNKSRLPTSFQSDLSTLVDEPADTAQVPPTNPRPRNARSFVQRPQSLQIQPFPILKPNTTATGSKQNGAGGSNSPNASQVPVRPGPSVTGTRTARSHSMKTISTYKSMPQLSLGPPPAPPPTCPLPDTPPILISRLSPPPTNENRTNLDESISHTTPEQSLSRPQSRANLLSSNESQSKGECRSRVHR